MQPHVPLPKIDKFVFPCGVGNRRLDVLFVERGILAKNILIGFARLKVIEDDGHHDPRALDAGLAVAHAGID